MSWGYLPTAVKRTHRPWWTHHCLGRIRALCSSKAPRPSKAPPPGQVGKCPLCTQQSVLSPHPHHAGRLAGALEARGCCVRVAEASMNTLGPEPSVLRDPQHTRSFPVRSDGEGRMYSNEGTLPGHLATTSQAPPGKCQQQVPT